MTFKLSLTCNIYLIQSYSSKEQIEGNKSVLNENIELCNENIGYSIRCNLHINISFDI